MDAKAYDLLPPNWALWRLEESEEGRPFRALYRADGLPANAADPASWTSFEAARAAANGHGGVAFCTAESFTAYVVDAGTGELKEASNLDIATSFITFFPDQRAMALSTAEVTLPLLAELIGGETAPSKFELPWLKLAKFGDKRSELNCLRTNDNTEWISGIETDYDLGEITFEEAVEIVRGAKLRALLYTSPSYIPATKERWRVLCPLSKNHPGEARAGLVAEFNGLFGGKLAIESFTLSLSYLFGHVDGATHREVVLDGDYLDLRPELAATGKSTTSKPRRNGDGRPPRSSIASPGRNDVEIRELLEKSRTGGEWHMAMLSATASMIGKGWTDNEIFDATEPYCDEGWGDDDIEDLIKSARKKWNRPDPIEDWSTRLGAQLKALAANDNGPPSIFTTAPEQDWSDIDPVDLWSKFDPPLLPRGVLPKLIEDFAFDQGGTLGADPAGIAVGALVVCGAAIPDRIKLQPKQHDPDWLEEARIWGGLIGPVSGMKTPIMNTVVRPLRALDTEMAQRNQRAMATYNRLPKEEKQRTEVPTQPRLMLQDTTIEAAQEVLKDSPTGVLCFRDELSGWFGSMDKYAGARGSASDRAFWLQAYNGGAYALNRIGRGSTVIPNLSVCILGGIQPEPIRKIAGDSVDDGLLQRLIPVVLRAAVAGRDEERAPFTAEYAALIGKLHRIGLTILGGGTLSGEILRFDAGAMAIRAALEKKHLELQQCESIHRKLSAHIGKYNGIFCRMCVIWHCVEHAGAEIPAIVTADVAQRVADFLHGFLLPHALSFYAGTLGLSNDHDRLAAVAGYILARKLDHVTNRDIQRGDGNMRNLKRHETEAIFEQLDALGWLARVPGPRPSSPPHWEVNPAVHVKFAEKAKAEAERRKREREMIGEMLRGA